MSPEDRILIQALDQKARAGWAAFFQLKKSIDPYADEPLVGCCCGETLVLAGNETFIRKNSWTHSARSCAPERVHRVRLTDEYVQRQTSLNRRGVESCRQALTGANRDEGQ